MALVILRVFLAVLLAGVFACTAPAAAGPTPTPAPQRATVTDHSAPFASTESGALVARGFEGNADLGRLAIGCLVQVLKTTDRGAQVKVLSCPSPSDANVPVGTQGWVAKSALDIKSP